MKFQLKRIFKGKMKVTIPIIFIILALTPFLAAVSTYFFTTREALHRSAVGHLETLADWESTLIYDWFGSHTNTIKMLAVSPEVISGDPREFNNLLSRVKKFFPEYGSIGIADRAGKIVANSTGTVGRSVADRLYFKAGMMGQDYVSEMIMSRSYNKPCLVFSSPVIRNGKVDGVLYGSVALDTLNNIVMGFGLGKTEEHYLVDNRGNLITIPIGMRRGGLYANRIVPAPKDSGLTEGMLGKSGTMVYSDYMGKNVIGVHRWLPQLKILLVTKQDEQEALEEAGGGGLKASIMAGIILLLVALPVAWLVARRISNPLAEVAEAVDQIASGNLSYRLEPLKGNEEIATLGEQLNGLAYNLQRSLNVISEQMNDIEAQKEEISAQNDDVLRAYEKLTLANQNLQQMATTDQLTETHNRRFFIERLRTEVLISLRSQRPLALALLDIDHFKVINDTWGHKVGDIVLRELVKVISSNIRRSDLLARFGGEEFIILAPETTMEGAINLAEKIRVAVENHRFSLDEGSINITVSIGVVELKDFTNSLEKTEDQLLVAVDHFLYEAKRGGRNRVESPSSD